MKIKHVTFGVLLVIVIAIGLLQLDDDLDPRAQAMLASIDWQTHSGAYIYLMGIDALPGSDPLEVGTRVLKEIRSLEAHYNDLDVLHDVQLSRDRPTIELLDHDAFCHVKEPECLSSLFSDFDVSLANVEAEVIKQRYLTFMSMSDYRTQSAPHFFEPFPSYSHLRRGNRLVSLSAISSASAGEAQIAADQLYRLIELEKKFILQADSLITKMIAYALFNETVDVLSLILQKYNLKVRQIELLNPEHLSFDKAINREFAYIKSSISVEQINEGRGFTPDWVVRMIFKENMTVNAALPVYENSKAMANLPIHEFTKMAKNNTEIKLKSSWVRNFFGSTLNRIAQIDTRPYIARGLDLNVKLVLFNKVLSQSISNDGALSIVNPYYNVTQELSSLENENRLCFDGPIEDTRFFRCLTILKSESQHR